MESATMLRGLLSAAETDRVERQAEELRESWIQRDNELPFFTLGAASYLDARHYGETEYLERAARINLVMIESFGWLYERVTAALTETLGVSVHLDSSLAVPGFHIFLAHPAFTRPVADLHFDLQYQYIDWSRWGGIRPDSQTSWTLAIRLPAAGGGLALWPSSWEEVRDLEPDERVAVIRRNTDRIDEDYLEGGMVVHSGHWLHQIRPSRSYVENDRRITLQGHVIETGKGWITYW